MTTIIRNNGIDFDHQSSTPTTPTSGKTLLYFKSDGFLYAMRSNGTEYQIGSNVVFVYTPTTSGNWSVVPDDVAQALDELASRVKALETP